MIPRFEGYFKLPCPKCGAIQIIDFADIRSDLCRVDAYERQMGHEVQYSSEYCTSCDVCKNEIEFVFDIWEYPSMTLNAIQVNSQDIGLSSEFFVVKESLKKAEPISQKLDAIKLNVEGTLFNQSLLKNEIEGNINESERKEWHCYPLFHAINLKDYLNYIHHKGIVCRETLISCGNYTPFESDGLDKERGYLSRTFANFFDNNRFFWEISPEQCYPCAYGPITIKLSLDAWRILEDPVITEGTIGSVRKPDFVEEKDIKNYFENNTEYELEVNFLNKIIPTCYFECVIVDPISINKEKLIDIVKEKSKGKINIVERVVHPKALPLFSSMFEEAVLGKSQKRIFNSKKQEYAFNNWKQYFKDGTYDFICSNLS